MASGFCFREHRPAGGKCSFRKMTRGSWSSLRERSKGIQSVLLWKYLVWISFISEGFLDQLNYPARFRFSVEVSEGKSQAHLFDQWKTQ